MFHNMQIDVGAFTSVLGPCAGDVSRGRVSSMLRHFEKAHPGPAFPLSREELVVPGAMLPSCLPASADCCSQTHGMSPPALTY